MTGNQVVFMDPYVVFYPRENRNQCASPVNGVCSGPDARWNNFRDNLGFILRYSRRVNLANVTPRASLCSTGYCLAQTPTTGAEYLVYSPNGGSFTVNLSAMSSARTLNVEWFNPSTGATTTAAPIAAGSSSRSFTPPFGGDAVLYLVDSAGHAGSPAPPAATSFRVTGLAPGTYQYRVRAADAAANLGPYSNVAAATVQTTDTQAPTVPTALTATAAGASANQPELDCFNGQRRCRRVRGCALPGCGLFRVQPYLDAVGDRDHVRRYGADGIDQLQIPGPGVRCREQSERLFDDSHRYDGRAADGCCHVDSTYRQGRRHHDVVVARIYQLKRRGSLDRRCDSRRTDGTDVHGQRHAG